MRSADDQDFQRRLSAALDEIQPGYSLPRYKTQRPRSVVWRLAPAALAAAGLSALVATAYAGTGSTSPAVWAGTAVNVIAPPPAPPTGGPARPAAKPKPTQQPAPDHHESPEPRESPDTQESRSGPSDSGDSGR